MAKILHINQSDVTPMSLLERCQELEKDGLLNEMIVISIAKDGSFLIGNTDMKFSKRIGFLEMAKSETLREWAEQE